MYQKIRSNIGASHLGATSDLSLNGSCKICSDIGASHLDATSDLSLKGSFFMTTYLSVFSMPHDDFGDRGRRQEGTRTIEGLGCAE
jgi:hypothetical protein